jgi:hypothetical protein
MNPIREALKKARIILKETEELALEMYITSKGDEKKQYEDILKYIAPVLVEINKPEPMETGTINSDPYVESEVCR